MNNYNYEYMNYPENIVGNDMNFYANYENSYPTNSMDNERVNYMPNMDHYKIQFLNQKTSNNTSQFTSNPMSTSANSSSVLEPYQGFIRGNMFANLYDGYKNYKPDDINSSSERENLLNQWQQYNFALVDLNLYLDTHPNDSNALKLYQNYLNITKKIGDKYEEMYGPLTTDSNTASKNGWNWIRSPWPWEEM